MHYIDDLLPYEPLCSCIHVLGMWSSFFYYTIIIQQKILFGRSFLYSPCPNLKGINDAVLCYKFRRPIISQNYSAVCTDKGGHRDAFSNKQHKVPCVSRGLLSCSRAGATLYRWLTRGVGWGAGGLELTQNFDDDKRDKTCYEHSLMTLDSLFREGS